MPSTNNTEDKTNYHYVNGERIPLVRDDEVYVVRFKRNSRLATEEMSSHGQRFIFDNSEEIDFVSNYGLKVFQASLRQSNFAEETKEAVMNRLVGELNKETPIEYASVAYRDVPEDRRDAILAGEDDPNLDEFDLMFTTNKFVVGFDPDVSDDWIAQLNDEFGVTIVKRLGYVENGYLLRAPQGEGDLGPVALANKYYETGRVEFATPDFVRKRNIRTDRSAKKHRVWAVASEFGLSSTEVIDRLAEIGIFVENNLSTIDEQTYRKLRADLGRRADRRSRASASTTDVGDRISRDTYLNRQWHLELSGVRDAWSLTKGDPSIRIAVIDDGVDVGHPEFVHNTVWEYDYDGYIEDARPKLSIDNHGTACAGVAVAAGENAFGAAPDCSLMAVRYPPSMGVAAEAEMFQEVCDAGADVITCSWGPTEGAYELMDNVRHAIDYCVEQGRIVDGTPRGVPILWAAGNDSESVDTDGYASYEKVIAIAASTSEDTHAWYSEYGDSIWVAAPSDGGEQAIFTTDRRYSEGYNTGTVRDGDSTGNYYDSFGGTSSAAPLVAGVAGLMLTANPTLRHSEVREILAKTAEKIGGVSYTVSPSDPLGESHHPRFGYGRINAFEAVKAAAEGLESTEDTPTIEPIGDGPYDRADSPPRFSVDLGSTNTVYVVEVATRAELFDDVTHGHERTAENFYPIWGEDSLEYQTADTYTLPAEVWARLEETDTLYYRMHSASSTASGWPDYHVTTRDINAQSAPWINVVDSRSSC